MKAKGHLADIAYIRGIERDDSREEARAKVMATIARCAKDRITVAADALACYPKVIKAAMPQADIKQIHSRKKEIDGKFDPLFGINHTCALLRHDLSRLRRKTWVTTKRLDRLFLHLYLYIAYHNKYSKQMFSYR